MPTISFFLGIYIRMYFDEHVPSHFHAYYGDYSAAIEIETFRVLKGHLPQRVLGLVLEWASLHREELLEDWSLAQSHKPLRNILPLE